MTKLSTKEESAPCTATPSPSSEEEIPGHLTRSLIGLEPTERTMKPFDREQLWRAPATEPEPEQNS